MSREFIQRVTASNGSVFTGPGTNSYLIGKDDITLVDPGPKIDAHIEHLINLGEGKIKRILVTHTHRDHSPAAKVLGEMLKVPLMGRLLEKDDSLQDRTFKPDRILEHGDLIKTNEYTIETVHTPGHASNHLCYLIQEEKVMLTGDHIMNGSTVVIAHPDGSMKDYLSSLELLRNYNFNKIGPGHGDFLDDPMAVVDPECRVIGVSGLRVADSSIFPRITNGNLNGPSIMVGEKASDHILGRTPLPASNQEPWIHPNWESQQR